MDCRLRTAKFFLVASLFFIVATSAAIAANWDLNGTTWQPLRIGAGGFLVGMDIAPDGTKVVRADTYGAYLWNPTTSQWDQLVTAQSMPEGAVLDFAEGVYEIKIAPSNSNRLYMVYRGSVYRSDNKGGAWAKTAFATLSTVGPNDGYRNWGQKMAIDPANPDVVYVGTPQNGLFVTSNGGASWQSVGSIPVSAGGPNGGFPGITGIGFDPRSGTTGGKTNTIFASSYGKGVYRSTNAGAAFSLLPGSPSAGVSHGKFAIDGVYYATAADGAKVWKYQGTSWTDITPTADLWVTVVADPFNAARVIAVRSGGFLDISTDRGATWSGIIWGPQGHNVRVATDIPWLAWTLEDFMSEGDMYFDPTVPNRLWFSEGIGVWYADVAGIPSVITFTSQSIGIEQLVANWIIAPPGGHPIVASWDRPVFRVENPDTFPTSHGPDRAQSILMGWSVDYASTDPSFIVGLMNWNVEKSGYSTDGGQTWSQFASQPPLFSNGKLGGSIAASTPTNFVWVPQNNGNPYYTTNGGASWAQVSIPGIPTTGETGWGWAYFMNRHIVAADRVTAGTFYLYNYGPSAAPSAIGIYRSSDGGATWTHVYSRAVAPGSSFNAKLRAVPGKAGHLFFTSGQQGNTGDVNPDPSATFMRSTDGGSTWGAVANVGEVYAFGFGKEASPDGYPAIFIAGFVNNVWGIWRSDDNAQSWIQISNFPLGSLDEITTVEGDKAIYGQVYIGFRGSGYAYGKMAVSTSPPFRPSPLGPTACNSTQTLGDLNGDRRSDLLFRRSDGMMAAYLMNGARVQSGQIIGAVGVEWSLVGLADFNGDGAADLLFRRSDGMLSLYLMNGFQVTQAQVLGKVGPEWQVVGVGDFNGDGKADILFRRASDGSLSLYLMNGFQVVSAQVFGAVGNEWRIVGIGDFNGDGRADLLFRRDDGMLSLFLMDGPQVLSATNVGAVGPDWRFVSAIDFDGDGRADMLLRRDDGTLSLFLMNGSQVQAAQMLGKVGTEWRLIGVGDLDGNATADLVFQRADGTLSAFLMNGFQILSAQVFAAVGVEWESCYGQSGAPRVSLN